MSGMASGSVMGVGVGGDELGYGGYRPPFTAVQWQELEQQAMVYKYLVAGVPVPPDLVLPIRHSLEALSARLFQHPSLGYCSYYGKKFDPEPGRCRRTDGKKWRCSKDAHSDSKYCERHMHRGRNRSRKPVESQSVIASSHISTNCTTQNIPFYSVGSNVTKLHSDVSYRMDSKEIRYNHVPTRNADDHNFSLETSRSVGNLGLGSNASSEAWNIMPSQVSSSSLFKRKADSQLGGHTLDPIDAAMPKQRQQQQHCFFGNDTSSAGPMKAEQNPMQLFFGEWSTTKESWSNLDDDDKQNGFSSTQLSMSIPRAASRSFSTNDA